MGLYIIYLNKYNAIVDLLVLYINHSSYHLYLTRNRVYLLENPPKQTTEYAVSSV